MSTLSDQKIGIVTVLYNSNDVLPGFFDSLAKQQGICFHLYLLDNSPTDNGTRIAKIMAAEHGINATFIFNNANVGVAKGNNQGIQMALRDGCTHVLLANNDTEFGPTTIFDLWKSLDSGRELVSTPKIYYYGSLHLIWYAGGHINPWLMRTPHYGDRETDIGQLDHQRHVRYAPTCFMLLSREIFNRVGMMDERYFVYCDDTDFVWRMRLQGISIRYEPRAIVHHKVSSSTGGSFSPFTVYYTNRNRIFFIRKNLSGLQKAVALVYVIMTRIPRLAFKPSNILKSACSGLRDGFLMSLNEHNVDH